MKILMLNPAFGKDFCRSARWAARSRGRVQRHPDWMLIATAVLEQAGHKVRFVDAAALNYTMQDVQTVLEQFRPELAVIHTTTPSIYNDVEYASLCKRFGCITVLIGPHVSALPHETFALSKDIDAIAISEYDYTLRDIAQGTSFADILGLAYRDGDEVKVNPSRPALDIKELPFPAWHHIDPKWYKDAGKRFPFLTLISGRGCPNHCTFCRDTATMYGRKLRLRTAKQVVDEIEYDFRLFPYLKEIMFETDTFTANTKHVQEICEELLSRDLKITWSCNARVDMDLSLLPLMKNSGCRMLMVGYEFGSQESLDAVKKGITLKQSKEFTLRAKELGFIIHGCFMIGAPNETPEHARETIEFAKSLPLDTVQFSGICPYPGTELYKWAKEHGYLLAKDWTDWVSKDLEQVTLLNYPNLTKQEMDALIDKALKEFYLRPRQVFALIKTIKRPEDFIKNLYGFKSFLQYFYNKN